MLRLSTSVLFYGKIRMTNSINVLLSKLILVLMGFFKNTPFYPHWLDFRNKHKGHLELSPYIYGEVLETGCGNCENKSFFLKRNTRISQYTATDFNSWDPIFEQDKVDINKWGTLTRLAYGNEKDEKKLT